MGDVLLDGGSVPVGTVIEAGGTVVVVVVGDGRVPDGVGGGPACEMTERSSLRRFAGGLWDRLNGGT